MKNKKIGKFYTIMFFICIAASIVCSILIITKILPVYFSFLSIFIIAVGSTLYNLSNSQAAEIETETRREKHSKLKEQDRNRYL